MYKTDKQQGSTGYHRQLYSVSCNKPEPEKEYVCMCVCVCKTESLSSLPETL